LNTDPRRAWVDVLARMGQEIQLHLDERYRHFRITDAVIIGISLLLVVLAVFNVYYVSVLYKDLNGIVSNMESMYDHLLNVDEDMGAITQRIDLFDKNMAHMQPIHDDMQSLSNTMPTIRVSMHEIAIEMDAIRQDMGLLSSGMTLIDQSVHQMTGGVATMRANLGEVARPMGAMNPFMP